jgi:hypothetical protein
MMPCWFDRYLGETEHLWGEKDKRAFCLACGAVMACFEDAAVTVTFDPIYEIPT